MKKKPFKVLIPTSGLGTPLGDITKYLNKTLVKIGKKPVISYIIEAYPQDTEFIVTLGHMGNQVRDFLGLVYPDRKIRFIMVDKYEGKGSSLGYSMLQAEPLLQEPFIYHASDTLVLDPISSPHRNWIGGFRGEGSSLYDSFDVVDEKVQQMHNKGMIDPDFLHIGLVGIFDYMSFWKQLKKSYKRNPNDSSLGDVSVIRKMLNQGDEFSLVEFKKWHDIGNVESLHKARVEIEDSFRILDKSDESIFIFDTFVVKFFADEKTVAQRVARGKLLKGLAPAMEGATKNFYRYKYASGKLYSKVATPADFSRFLVWTQRHLWKSNREISDQKFKKVCHDFYYTKTVERIEKLLGSRKVNDTEIVINGEKVPTVKKMLKMIDFNWLCDAEQSGFHGDFILDNLLKSRNGYVLLDWRQNFGGLLKSGDLYYDLAKLNHNLTVNHEIVNNDQFTIKIEKNEVSCDILRKENLVQCQRVLFEFLEENGYNSKKVRILTALIWLNMSPLHHHPFDLFLFYFGKLNLWRALEEK